MEGQLKATLPDSSTLEIPASETPPNNEAGEQLTDHSKAVLTEGVPEAEATPENEQDVILPPEDQASTHETVEEPKSYSEQGPVHSLVWTLFPFVDSPVRWHSSSDPVQN